MLDTLIQGLLLGGLYALFALGLSLMFGVMRLTNTAQGDFIVLAAFAAIAIAPFVASQSVIAALLLLPLSFAFGYALQRWVLNGTLGRDPLPSLVVTFGLSIVIQNALLEVFSADPRSLDSAGFNTTSLAIGGGFPDRRGAHRDFRRGVAVRWPCRRCSTARSSGARFGR